jgi:hypothetical protein
MTIWEARPASCRPETPGAKEGPFGNATFSVGVGEADSRSAAIYRVTGRCEDDAQVDALAARLVEWLNHPETRGEMEFVDLPFSSDKSARIKITPAGRERGFLP